MSATPASILFAAKRTLLFQKPPHERPGPDELLLMRLRQDGGNTDEPEPNLWRFPRVGEFEHSAKLEPWTDSTFIARVDASFDPPGIASRDFFWASRDFAIGCSRAIYHPDVMPALRRFGGDLLDQIMAGAEALADSTHGDFTMSTTIDNLQRQLDTLKRQIGPPAGNAQEFRTAQVKADRAYRALGDDAPAPLSGENLLQYRTRLLSGVQHLSPKWKAVPLDGCNSSVLTGIEDSIYADAMAESRHPTAFRPGELRAIREADPSGRIITRFVGDPGAVWDSFSPGVRFVRRFCTPGR